MGTAVAQVRFVSLKNCFANLPRPLVDALVSSNAVFVSLSIYGGVAEMFRLSKMSLSKFNLMNYSVMPTPAKAFCLRSTLDGLAWQAQRTLLLSQHERDKETFLLSK